MLVEGDEGERESNFIWKEIVNIQHILRFRQCFKFNYGALSFLLLPIYGVHAVPARNDWQVESASKAFILLFTTEIGGNTFY